MSTSARATLVCAALLALGCAESPSAGFDVAERFHEAYPGAVLDAGCDGTGLLLAWSLPQTPHPFVEGYALLLHQGEAHVHTLPLGLHGAGEARPELEVLEACAPVCTFTLVALDGDGQPSDPLLVETVTLDADGDGYLAMACGGDDCDDDDPFTYPGAPELCDGADNSCSGVIDDVPPEVAPLATNQDGVCEGSVRVCEGGTWREPTASELFAHSEHYDPVEDCNGLDNSCSGEVDDVLPEDAPLATNQDGVCAGSVRVCEEGAWFDPDEDELRAQRPDYDPVELCNGLDNSCSGLVDDIDLTDAPYAENQQGVCLGAKQVCDGDGGWRQPEPADLLLQIPTYHPIEDCNGLDNSCTGEVDDVHEDDAPDATNQQGVCEGSRKVCEGGAWREPTPEELAANIDDYEEVETLCDGLDNSCNGDVDWIWQPDPDAGDVICWGSQRRATPQLTDAGPWASVALDHSDYLNEHACAIDVHGVLHCWGNNAHGQLGDGTYDSRRDLLPIPGTWQAVELGRWNTCGIRADDSLWCWGRWFVDDDFEWFTTPEPLAAGEAWDALSVSSHHACGLKTDGSLWCWGDNADGALGNEEVDFTFEPVPSVEGVWISVTTGRWHTCALRADGALACWGWNDSGQLGTDVFDIHHEPVWLPSPGEDLVWTSVAAGGWHTCALDSEDRAWCWGWNNLSQAGGATAGFRPDLHRLEGPPFRHLDPGQVHTCALDDEDRRWCWGWSNSGFGIGDGGTRHEEPVEVGHPPWATVRSGAEAICAIHAEDGSLWCWGIPSKLALGPPHQHEPRVRLDLAPIAIAVGQSHRCAVDAAGTLKCWGENTRGEIGRAGYDWDAIPHTVDVGETRFVALTAGSMHTCGLDDGGHRWCWGHGDRIGQGTRGDQHEPWQDTARTYLSIEAGQGFACALANDHALWCWGSNTSGQIGKAGGDELSSSYLHPQRVLEDATWRTFSTGSHFACAIRFEDNTLWCWGRNNRGQLGRGETFTSSSVPMPIQMSEGDPPPWRTVAGGGDFACAISQEDALWCWGDATQGQLGPGHDTLSAFPVQMEGTWNWVAAGERFACGERTDGSVACWGLNTSGQLAVPSPDRSPTPIEQDAEDWTLFAPGLYNACAARAGLAYLECPPVDEED